MKGEAAGEMREAESTGNAGKEAAGKRSSEISEFYKKSLGERLEAVKEFGNLDEKEVGELKKYSALDFETADRMIENVFGTFALPLGIATNFRINGKDYLVPMAIEEPSVVAAASNAAKLARELGGFKAEADEPVMIGQIQVVGLGDAESARKAVEGKAKELVASANDCDPVLVKFGGGARKLEAGVIETARGKMLVVHLLVDVRDAMGANAVNTMCEAIAPEIEKLAGGRIRLRIISNLATERKARASAVWKKEAIGEDAVEGILDAYEFAANDVYRCATHNKGIMNGIDAVAIACGQDFRALEAGAHAFAALGGKYKPLTRYSRDKEGNLAGEIELPVAVGLVGGAIKTHPIAKIAVKILGIKTAKELAEVIAAVGLAQNFAALRALATEGIQKGHMKLHAKNIAVLAGAEGKEIEKVAGELIKGREIRTDRAQEILGRLREGAKGVGSA